MMNTVAKKRDLRLKQGTVIEGKWHYQTYSVIRLLGEGTVGAVYLCKSRGRRVAVKISEQSLSMTAEVQKLKMLQKTKVQDSGLGPSLLEVDDWQINANKRLVFYVMEFIEGVSLPTYIQANGSVFLGTLLFQLLDQLDQLHKSGYVFGDLKSDNIIVVENPLRIRLIDVGGITKIGRSVKEYTNFYDRAYWRLGKRLAEPSYDLFALTMVFLAVFYPQKFTRSKHNLPYLQQKINDVKSLRFYRPVMQKTLTGRYSSAQLMREDLYKQLTESNSKKKSPSLKSFVKEIILIGGCATLYYGIYLTLMNI